MIYRIIKPILKLALGVFFKKIVITGKELLPNKGPLIIAANHPNTFMDPLIIATLAQQRVGFIANAGIFGNKFFASILRYFHVIPIYRKKDIAPGEKPDNAASFAACHDYLERNGTIIIFPEGSSYYELKLREIKTGTARIALSFEALKDFEGNLKIAPISLDYSDSLQFRSMLSVNIGEPILVNEYQKDEPERVIALTEEIRNSLGEHIPQTVDKDQESYLINAHRFYTTFFEPSASLYVNPKESLSLRNILSKSLASLKSNDEKRYLRINTLINDFYDGLKNDGITAGFYTEQFRTKSQLWVYLGYILTFILLLPLYIFGLLANYIPYILPTKIFALLNIDIEYKTSVALVVGLVLFPVTYGIELILFRHFVSTEILLNSLFLLLLPISGYVAMFYWTNMKRFGRLLRFHFSISKKRKNSLIELRDEILNEIKLAREALI